MGYLLVKDVYGTLSLESSNLANLNPSSKDKATRTSTKGVLYQRTNFCRVYYGHGVLLRFNFIIRHDVGYLLLLIPKMGAMREPEDLG